MKQSRVLAMALVALMLLTGPPPLTSAQQPAESPAPAKTAEQKSASPVGVGSALLYGAICTVAATMGGIVLVGTLGTTWSSYKDLLQCLTGFLRPPATRLPSKAGATVATPEKAGGGGRVTAKVKGEEGERGRDTVRPSPGFVIIDAAPPQAQVFLDGGLLGTAQGVIAQGFSLAPGRHTVEITASGFRPYRAQFLVESDFATRIHAVLKPE